MNIRYIGLIIAAPILIVMGLYQFSDQPNERPNGFSRNYQAHNPIAEIEKNNLIKIKGIAGSTKSSLYFYTYNAGEIISVSLDNLTLKSIRLNLPDSIYRATTIVDSPDVFIADGSKKCLHKINFYNNDYIKINVPGQIFTRAVLLSNLVFLRQFIDHIRDQQIVSLKMRDSILIPVNTYSYELNYDSGIGADGIFCVDRSLSTITYLHFRKNQLITMDTALKVLCKGKTIDTISHIKPLNRKHGKLFHQIFTSEKPDPVFNYYGRAQNNKLYVYSGLKGDNELLSDFNRYNTIDVYRICPSRYLYSFHLPKINNKSIICFSINGDKLTAAYPEKIIQFRIHD